MSQEMTIVTTTDVVAVDPVRLRAEVEDFYARQMQLLDQGRAEEWAATFTPDGVFGANAFPEPTVGRDALTAAARDTRAGLDAQGMVHRHWLGMVTADPAGDDTVVARCYALVIATPKGGQPVIHRSTVCEDELQRSGDGFLVRHRWVTRDDL